LKSNFTMLYFIIPLIAGLLLYFLIFRPKSTKSIKENPEWHETLEKHISFYKKLNVEEKTTFRKRMNAFLQEVYIDAVDFELEEIDKIFVAASAVIPVFRFTEWSYNNLSGIIIYPDNFNEDLGFKDHDEARMIGGLVGTGRFEKQMILSRTALHHGFKNDTDKHNTGIHEFVHLLDKVDGQVNGLPEAFLEQSYIIPWMNLMYKEMEAIDKDESDIRSYGATNQAEFFAVASEYFFSRPDLMKRKHPEIYQMLELCFNPQMKKGNFQK